MFKAPIKLLVLRGLAKRPHTGYELLKLLETALGKRPSPGYMYPLLHDLQVNGLVSAKTNTRSTMYAITSKGKAMLSDLEASADAFIGSMKERYGDLIDPEELEISIKFHTRMLRYKPQILANMDLWTKFFDNTFKVYERNYPKKRKEFIEILRDTADKIETLARTK
jgi:DNA-binding PadR family transcriptional regulator